MYRSTCIDCEKRFAEAIIENGDLEKFLDGKIGDIDKSVCIKCLSRILYRYESNS